MRILHTADIHLGQILYQNYDRSEEHAYFFMQLENMITTHRPNLLIVAGDLFDIQNPSASCWERFNSAFVRLHEACPEMEIVIVAGNHDSASRVQSHSVVWRALRTHLFGVAPALNVAVDGWEKNYVVRIQSGYVVAFPFSPGMRQEALTDILEYVKRENHDDLPVVVVGHLAVSGSDFSGHSDIGRVRTVSLESLGHDFDYFALGHVHRPQTLGHPADRMLADVQYPAPVVRYSGSPLHVSADETYPHSVSLVEISKRGGEVSVRQLPIEQLRHFHVIPMNGVAQDAEAALDALGEFAVEGGEGYFRFRVKADAQVPADFNQRVYDMVEPYDGKLRYNPKILWDETSEPEKEVDMQPAFQVAEIQQMVSPFEFVERTIEDYPELNIDMLREAFAEIEQEIHRNRNNK